MNCGTIGYCFKGNPKFIEKKIYINESMLYNGRVCRCVMIGELKMGNVKLNRFYLDRYT